MKHSEFVEKYHWLNGLDEYFKRETQVIDGVAQNERWEVIFKALFHNNWYRKRDLILELVQRDKSDDVHVKSWLNVLLMDHIEVDYDKPQLIISLLRKYMKEDILLSNMVNFMNYWVDDNGEFGDAPDLGDFLSRGQIMSKLWLADELEKVIPRSERLGNVVFYGGWYNFFAYMLYHRWDVDSIYSLDMDSKTIEPCKRLYPGEVEEHRFFPIHTDVNNLKWEDNELFYPKMNLKNRKTDHYQSMVDSWIEKQEKKYTERLQEKEAEIRQGYTTPEEIREGLYADKEDVFARFKKAAELSNFNKIGKVDLVVNTSCEHMNNQWFEDLPDGQLVVLHQNDYFDNEQHVNCCRDLNDVKKKYPMSELYYEGELDTYLYNRFMLIGRK